MRRCGGRLVHGSFPNESASQGRLSLVVHMIVDGTTFRCVHRVPASQAGRSA